MPRRCRAVRKRAHQLVTHVPKLGHSLHVTHAARDVALRDSAQTRHVAEVFVDAHVVVERRPIRQIADLFADLVRAGHHVEAADLHAAAGRQQIACQDPERRRFAGAVEAQQSDDLALFDFGRQRADDPPLAVVLIEILDLDHGCSARYHELRASGPRNRLDHSRPP